MIRKIQHAKRAFGSNPGIINRVFNTFDKSTTAYSIAAYRPEVELKGHKPSETADRD